MTESTLRSDLKSVLDNRDNYWDPTMFDVKNDIL